jgi:hypothetical protein
MPNRFLPIAIIVGGALVFIAALVAWRSGTNTK